MTPTLLLDIEVYENFGPGHWAQARYLVHGYDDVLWTDDLDAALSFLRNDLLLYAYPLGQTQDTP